MKAHKRGVSPFSSKASAVKNTTNQLKEQDCCAGPIKNAVGMKPKETGGYTKIKGTISG